MNAHKNARTTPFGRAVMIRRVLQEGWSVTAVAGSFEVSTRTVRKWLARFRREGWAGLENRSSAPHLVANKLPAPWLAMIARLRREYRMTGEEIALRLRLPRSTVASHLRRPLRLAALSHDRITAGTYYGQRWIASGWREFRDLARKGKKYSVRGELHTDCVFLTWPTVALSLPLA
jgi:transposase